MQYRPFGRTGVQVSPLCLGCMNFGWKTESEPSYRIIDRAVEAGINFVDTANVYGRGASEQIVGEGLRRNGKRHRVVLCTKVWGTMNDDDPNAGGPARRHIIEQCEASLRRLRTEWIDLYQIHKPSHDVPIDETLRALDDLVRSGKVRYIGTTTFPAWRVVESLWASKEYGLNRFVSEQPPYHLLDRRIERELVPMAQAYGMALIPWSPLASGFLTGKYSGPNRPGDARIQDGSGRAEMMFQNEQAQQVVKVLEAIGGERGASPLQVALAWNMNQPAITAPIIGPRTLQQLEENLKAADLTLNEAELKRLDEVAPPGRAIIPYYEADWATTDYRW